MGRKGKAKSRFGVLESGIKDAFDQYFDRSLRFPSKEKEEDVVGKFGEGRGNDLNEEEEGFGKGFGVFQGVLGVGSRGKDLSLGETEKGPNTRMGISVGQVLKVKGNILGTTR